MTIGRSSEIEYLKKIFNSDEGSLVTLYGRGGVGTSTVWHEFVKDKKYVYITLDMDYYFSKTDTTPREVIRIAPDCIKEI